MQSPVFEFDQNNFIKDQIHEFKDHIKQYHETLNTEGVWLFLAALGCWGVPHVGMQKAAFVFTLIIFSYRVFKKLSDTRSFKEIYSQLLDEISSSALSEDTKKARLYDLDKIRSKYMGVVKGIKSMPIFIGCYGFTLVSLAITS